MYYGPLKLELDYDYSRNCAGNRERLPLLVTKPLTWSMTAAEFPC